MNSALSLGSRSGQHVRRRAFMHSRRFLSTTQQTSRLPKDGLTLVDFIHDRNNSDNKKSTTVQQALPSDDSSFLFHLKTYGCQMNVNDSDIVRSLLLDAGMFETDNESEAQVLLTNTCAIREGAETKVWNRLKEIRSRKSHQVVGVLGCMAERLKHDLFQDGIADLVVGPDAYRDLPNLIDTLLNKDMEQAVNVQLSLEETYANVTPVRKNPNDVSAFVSVMRGCNNMCSYCVVPFTRGRERSRPFDSIVEETKHLVDSGVKEIVLLGQNVNSYHDKSEASQLAKPASDYQTSNQGFTNLYKLRGGAGYYFADLVEAVSDVSPELRVRFTSPHPKDYPNELLQLMAERPNVCNQLHMPAQSGSSSVLKRMRRGYTREAYLELIETVRHTVPDVAISSDFITGFCGETQEEHLDTLSLMELVEYDQAYMFAYSMRGKTHAHRSMQDDISQDVKSQRLQQVIQTFRTKVQERNDKMELGKLRLVLVEGESKRSNPQHYTLQGRTDQNKRIVFDRTNDCFSHNDIALQLKRNNSVKLLDRPRVSLETGDYAVVVVTEARGHTLRGHALWRTTLTDFNEMENRTDASRMSELGTTIEEAANKAETTETAITA